MGIGGCVGVDEGEGVCCIFGGMGEFEIWDVEERRWGGGFWSGFFCMISVFDGVGVVVSGDVCMCVE